MLRIDLVFSYWIFAWYLLYIFHIIHISPKFALIISLFENFVMLLFMIYYSSYTSILYFLLINLFIKVIPFYTVMNDKIRKENIIQTILLFFIYSLWIYVNKYTVLEYQKKVFSSLIHNTNQTPFLWFINKYISKI